jgi:hypothetical protein
MHMRHIVICDKMCVLSVMKLGKYVGNELDVFLGVKCVRYAENDSFYETE